jgi:hypothetical protein
LLDYYENFEWYLECDEEMEKAKKGPTEISFKETKENEAQGDHKKPKPKIKKDATNILYMQEAHRPRAAIWSEPLRERNPGDPEQYGDIDPLLAILWEGDAMKYLRSLDCAYIAEICCPHHAVVSREFECVTTFNFK